MPHTYNCEYLCSCGTRIKWSASWEMLCADNDTEQFRIREGSDAYDIILGYSSFGDTRFLCIPSLFIALQVDSFQDCNCIETRLLCDCKLDQRKAVTISKGLLSYFES